MIDTTSPVLRGFNCNLALLRGISIPRVTLKHFDQFMNLPLLAYEVALGMNAIGCANLFVPCATIYVKNTKELECYWKI